MNFIKYVSMRLRMFLGSHIQNCLNGLAYMSFDLHYHDDTIQFFMLCTMLYLRQE